MGSTIEGLGGGKDVHTRWAVQTQQLTTGEDRPGTMGCTIETLSTYYSINKSSSVN